MTSTRSVSHALLAPLRGAILFSICDRGCRSAQPPANGWHPCRGARDPHGAESFICCPPHNLHCGVNCAIVSTSVPSLFPHKFLQPFAVDFGDEQISRAIDGEHVRSLELTRLLTLFSPDMDDLTHVIELNNLVGHDVGDKNRAVAVDIDAIGRIPFPDREQL